MPKVSGEIRINTPKEKVWGILANIVTVQDWNPGVTKAYYTSDVKDGVGASRHCDFPDGGYVKERVTEWKPGEAYTLNIYEGSTPFENADGRFTVKDEGQRTTVSFTLEYELKSDAQVDPREVERQWREEAIPTILAGLKHYVETGKPMPMPTP